jgi:hypothetical protein
MKQKKNSNKEKKLLNTNEVMHDYEFHLKMIIENQTLDFESDNNIP